MDDAPVGFTFFICFFGRKKVTRVANLEEKLSLVSSIETIAVTFCVVLFEGNLRFFRWFSGIFIRLCQIYSALTIDMQRIQILNPGPITPSVTLNLQQWSLNMACNSVSLLPDIHGLSDNKCPIQEWSDQCTHFHLATYMTV